MDKETEGEDGEEPGWDSCLSDSHITDCYWCSEQFVKRADMVSVSRAHLLVKEIENNQVSK